MKLGFYRNFNPVLGSFMQSIWDRLEPMGHECVRVMRGEKVPEDLDIFFVWNGEKNSMKGMVFNVQKNGGLNVFCEHGYLRRKTSWQMDLNGINAASSNRLWQSFPEPKNPEYDSKLVANIREAFKLEHGIQYEEPEDYALVVLQTNTDVNITNYIPRYMNMGRLVSDVKFVTKDAFPNLKLVFREHPKVASKSGIKLPPLSEQLNKCRFLITINSNTAHETMIAQKDVIALGPHIYTGKTVPGNGGVSFHCNKSIKKIPEFIDQCEARIKSGEAQNDPIRDRYLRYVWDREWTVEEIKEGPGLLDLIQGKPKKIGCTVEMQPGWDVVRARRLITGVRRIGLKPT